MKCFRALCANDLLVRCFRFRLRRPAFLKQTVQRCVRAVFSLAKLVEAGVPAELIRISLGLEDKEDLIADISNALDAIQ